MVPRLEFGHLAKFLASVGLLLIAASVLLPWLFSQSAVLLLTPLKQMEDLTPVAQSVLFERQQGIAFVQEYLLWPGSVLVFLTGVASLVWGLVRWQKRQSNEDLTADLTLEAAKAQIRPASSDEIEADLLEEATEPQESPDKSIGGQGDASSAGHIQPMEPISAARSRMERLREAEGRLVELAEEAYESSFDVQPHMRVSSSRGGAFSVVDVLLNPIDDGDWGQLALDIKLSTTRMLTSRVPESMVRMAISTQGLKGGNVYSGSRGRPAAARVRGILIYVLDEEQDRAAIHRFSRTVEDVNAVLRHPVGTLVFTAEHFMKLRPAELRAQVASAWSLVKPESIPST